MTFKLKRRYLLIVVLICFSIITIGSWYILKPKGRKTIAPEFSLTDLENVSFFLNDFRGKVVIIDFMATWCGYCKQQIPHLNVIWQNERYVDKIVLLSISVDPSESEEALRDFRQMFPNATWIWARDSANLTQAYEVIWIPKTVIIDQEGFIRFTHIGVIDASSLSEEIDKLLA